MRLIDYGRMEMAPGSGAICLWAATGSYETGPSLPECEKQTNDDEETGDVLYQGIAARIFARRFQLADHVQIRARVWRTGSCDLVREIPQPGPALWPLAGRHAATTVLPSDLEEGAFNKGRSRGVRAYCSALRRARGGIFE